MNVSIITVCRNSEKTIVRALDSVYGQRHITIQHVIVDGVSSDDTLDLIRAHPNPNIELVSEPDAGIYDALNKGLVRAKGDVVGFLHSDDIFASDETVARMVGLLEEHDVEGVYANLRYINGLNDQSVREWKSKAFEPHLLKRGWMPPHPTIFLRSSVYKRLGGFDTSYRIAGDYEFVLRLFKDELFSSFHAPQTEVIMNTGGASNGSVRRVIQKMREDIAAMLQHGVNPWIALPLKNLSKVCQITALRSVFGNY